MASPSPPTPALGQPLPTSSPTPTAQAGNPVLGSGESSPAQPETLVAAGGGNHSGATNAGDEPPKGGGDPHVSFVEDETAKGNNTSANPELEPKGSAAGVEVTSQELEAVGFSPRRRPPQTCWECLASSFVVMLGIDYVYNTPGVRKRAHNLLCLGPFVSQHVENGKSLQFRATGATARDLNP
jgi:hypothetical protein